MRLYTYTIQDVSCDVGANPLIFDANLVAARFRPDPDTLFDAAEYVLADNSFDFLLPYSALVEAFHFCKPDPTELFQWIVQPNRVALLPEDTSLFKQAREWYDKPKRKGELDLVDCLLLAYAESVAKHLGRSRPIPIATADQPLINIARQFNPNFMFLDLNDDHLNVA